MSAERMDEVLAELARLRTEVAELRAERPTPAARLVPGTERAGPPGGDAAIDRRAALRKAGMMAAGAVAGGTALTAITASPAAAATLTGSGSPGVIAQGLGGDGLSASTDAATKSAVYATTATPTAYGAYVHHSGGGTAIEAWGASSLVSGVPTVRVANSGGGYALAVNGDSLLTGSLNMTTGPTDEGNSTLYVGTAQQGGNGLIVNGAGSTHAGSLGIQVNNYAVGAILRGGTHSAQLTSETNHLHLFPVDGAAPPTRASVDTPTGTVTQNGSDLWHCVAGGMPGSWRKVSGAGTAGAFHLLAAPARVYDSRPGTNPPVGTKTPLAPNTARTVDLKTGSAVPAGASGALLTILLVNATSGNGNATVWAQGVAKPLANTMVWGGNAARFTATAVSSCDPQARVQVSASLATDIVVDVVGFYR